MYFHYLWQQGCYIVVYYYKTCQRLFIIITPLIFYPVFNGCFINAIPLHNPLNANFLRRNNKYCKIKLLVNSGFK